MYRPWNSLNLMVIKCTVFQEDSWDVATIKNGSENEVITGDCGMLLERWA
jgi:hypothetical protein